MLKLFKMLQQIVSQLEQVFLSLDLKMTTLWAVSNFTRQFVPQKWSGAGKSAITKSLKISSGDLKEALVAGMYVVTSNGVWLQIFLNVLWALIVKRFVN